MTRWLILKSMWTPGGGGYSKYFYTFDRKWYPFHILTEGILHLFSKHFNWALLKTFILIFFFSIFFYVSLLQIVKSLPFLKSFSIKKEKGNPFKRSSVPDSL